MNPNSFNFKELQVVKDDGYLEPFEEHFKIRSENYSNFLKELNKIENGIVNFAQGYNRYGIIANQDGVIYREWAPMAKEVYLMGDFNNWQRGQYKCTKDQFGNFEVFIPNKQDGSCPIPHNSRVKAHILGGDDQWQDRIPCWISYTYQDQNTKIYDGVFWNPPQKFQFKNPKPKRPRALKIYEVHIGMAGVEERVHTYKEFQKNVLPRVLDLGYNTIQIMAVQEHAYYGSFGYHVTNFFAASSRFGTPDDLKDLIDAAHGMGIFVLMDLVHSHASSNVQDGINNWDGTDYHYFHSGSKGQHQLWDSKLFNYGKWEVVRFLLSNLSWWMNVYGFDGFRFDGITSMLYVHHGNGVGFTGNYHEYFNNSADMESLVYLMLANKLIHEISSEAVTIAEDVSGYPTLCRKIEEGGIGFDFRMQMAVPDQWIKLLKEVRDEDWNIDHIVHTLTNRRYKELCICYAECHDQALVGDKTLAMWLFDAEIYFNMSKHQQETLIVNRGIALHKMLRLITFALGGEGYLCFMGNEFGHPEWIDFPREGNGWSYHYARRRWDICDDNNLRFGQLKQFDKEMIHLEEKYPWLPDSHQYVSLKHQEDKIIVFERGGLLFVFNFHNTKSFEHYRIGTIWGHDHELVLDTDDVYYCSFNYKARFGGHSRVLGGYNTKFPIFKESWCNRPNYIQVYIPSRCALVFKPVQY